MLCKWGIIFGVIFVSASALHSAACHAAYMRGQAAKMTVCCPNLRFYLYSRAEVSWPSCWAVELLSPEALQCNLQVALISLSTLMSGTSTALTMLCCCDPLSFWRMNHKRRSNRFSRISFQWHLTDAPKFNQGQVCQATWSTRCGELLVHSIWLTTLREFQIVCSVMLHLE